MILSTLVHRLLSEKGGQSQPPSSGPVRIVLDSNVLIGAAWNQRSASYQIVQACLAGQFIPVLSDELAGENDAMTNRSCRRPGWREWYAALKGKAIWVTCDPSAHVVPADPDDNMVLATAVAGGCHYLITNDAGVLAMNGYQGLRVIRPGDFVRIFA